MAYKICSLHVDQSMSLACFTLSQSGYFKLCLLNIGTKIQALQKQFFFYANFGKYCAFYKSLSMAP